MAIKQRVLKKLNAARAALSMQRNTDFDWVVANVLSNLKDANDLSKRGLPKHVYEEYGDIFQGIIGALEQILSGMELGEQAEVIALTSDLVTYITDKLKETLFKKEVVFLPYKAEMWDSMESVWQAAVDDAEHSIEYVVPLPYYVRDVEGGALRWCCDAGKFPEYVPVRNYQSIDLYEMHPDVIIVHNPYDGYNNLTGVDKNYYSHELKKCTDLLIYIPYYVISGVMSAHQSYYPSYLEFDYIVVQSEKMIDFFDERIPREKFLPLGSPKFDKVISLCNQPPSPPEEWRNRLEGRRVFFYNTSIGNSLSDVGTFIKKLRYVFDCFKGREDVCLIWRPHPLLRSAIESAFPDVLEEYDRLKDRFVRDEIGIYDDTREVEKTIALSDAYIGDVASSVTALFGVVGKPLFFLRQKFPEVDDWRDCWHPEFTVCGMEQWCILGGRYLFHSPDGDYKYRYFCELVGQEDDEAHYATPLWVANKLYVFARNTKDVLVIADGGIVRRIDWGMHPNGFGDFFLALVCDNLIFWVSEKHSSLMCYDTIKDELLQMPDLRDFLVRTTSVGSQVGGFCRWKNWILVASPVENVICRIDVRNLEVELLAVDSKAACGCIAMIPDQDDIWLLPFKGHCVTRWNPVSGKCGEYDSFPENFECCNGMAEDGDFVHPFSSGLCSRDEVYLIPFEGNMYVRLNKHTGEMKEWHVPSNIGWHDDSCECTNCRTIDKGYVCHDFDNDRYLFFCDQNRKFYWISEENLEFNEIRMDFCQRDIERFFVGFQKLTYNLPYGCLEDGMNSLPNVLSGNIIGAPFDRRRQLALYMRKANNLDGSCGRKIYHFVQQYR